MANKKISELPEITTGYDASADVIPIVHDSITYKTKLNNLWASLTGPGAPFVSIATLLTSAGAAMVGYIQAGLGAVLRTVQDRLREKVSVLDYMTTAERADVTGRTASLDVTAAILTCLTKNPDKLIYFPAGIYRHSAVLDATNGGSITRTKIKGDGHAQTVFYNTSGTSNGWTFKSATTGGGIVGCTISGAAWDPITPVTTPGSTGIGLALNFCGDRFVVEDVLVTNYDTGIEARQCNGEYVNNVTVRYFTNYGISFPDNINQLEGRWSNVQINNISFSTPNTSVGLGIKQSGGHFFYNFDILSANIGVEIKPGATFSTSYCTFVNVLADTSLTHNWVVDGTNGGVVGCKASACWSSYATAGSGLVTKGSNLWDFQWEGGHLRENGFHGWHHQGGVDVRVVGASIGQNSKAANNTYDGVHIDAGVTQWMLSDCRVGNFGSGLVNGVRYSLFIAAGASDNFIVSGCDLRNANTGEISNGASGVNYQILSCLPLSVNRASSTNVAYNTVVRDSNGDFAGRQIGADQINFTGLAGAYVSKDVGTGNPGFSFDSNDYTDYNRTTNTYRVVIGSTDMLVSTATSTTLNGGSTVGNILRVTGAGTSAWGALDLTNTNAVTGNLPVTQGGTGRATSTTAYGLLAAGTTATGAHQTLAAGATTEILVGGGAAALPVWTTASGSGAPLRQTTPTITTAVLNGTITGTSQATASTASTLVMRDGSSNFAANQITFTTWSFTGLGGTCYIKDNIGTGNPGWSFDSNDYFDYDRTNNVWTYVIGSSTIYTVKSTGISCAQGIVSTGTAGVGYGTGAGGTVTQLTNRTTGVTINKTSGAITMFNAAGSATAATFTVTNSTVAATDTISLSVKSSTNKYLMFVTAVTAGTFDITFQTTGGTSSDAPVINFNVIKGVTS